MLSQLQPHFLYNALGTISSLCDVDAKLAKESIIDFGHYLRGNMDSITQKKPIPFTKEMEHVETYLALERRRFGDRLKVVYGIESTNFNLPSLALQLLVENAVRHGVTKRREGGTVTILASETPHEFRVAVADDGVGFDPECRERDGRSHVGIENVRYRVEAMCGGSLSVESTPGEGTNAVITIPKEAGSR